MLPLPNEVINEYIKSNKKIRKERENNTLEHLNNDSCGSHIIEAINNSIKEFDGSLKAVMMPKCCNSYSNKVINDFLKDKYSNIEINKSDNSGFAWMSYKQSSYFNQILNRLSDQKK